MIRRPIALLLFCAVIGWSMTAVARANDTIKLAIGQKGVWETAVAALGVEQGFFRKEGLDLDLSYTAGGGDTIQAVATGSADFGISVGTTAAIAAFAKGAPIRIVAGSMTGEPDIYFYVRAESPIKSMADANGKSIGFTRPGSSTFAAEHILAAQFNVVPNYVSTGEQSATLTQVMSGQVDIGWAAPPFGDDLVTAKKIRIIASGADAKDLAGQTVRVQIGNANFIKNHRDIAQRFWRAYAATLNWMYSTQNASLAAYARFADIPVSTVKNMLQFFPRKNLILGSVAEIDKSIKDAVTFKFIDKPFDASQTQAMFDILAPRT
jgi:NitT/TauT family transport system substrate-binding protein